MPNEKNKALLEAVRDAHTEPGEGGIYQAVRKFISECTNYNLRAEDGGKTALITLSKKDTPRLSLHSYARMLLCLMCLMRME